MNANVKCTNCERDYVPSAKNSACPHCGLGGAKSSMPAVRITCRHCSKTTFRVSANWPCPACNMTENASYGIAGHNIRCIHCEQEYAPLAADTSCPRCHK